MELEGQTGHLGEGKLTSRASALHDWLNILDPTAKPFEKRAEGDGRRETRQLCGLGVNRLFLTLIMLRWNAE